MNLKDRLSDYNRAVERIRAEAEAAEPRTPLERYIDHAILRREMELLIGTGPGDFKGIESPTEPPAPPASGNPRQEPADLSTQPTTRPDRLPSIRDLP